MRSLTAESAGEKREHAKDVYLKALAHKDQYLAAVAAVAEAHEGFSWNADGAKHAVKKLKGIVEKLFVRGKSKITDALRATIDMPQGFADGKPDPAVIASIIEMMERETGFTNIEVDNLFENPDAHYKHVQLKFRSPDGLVTELLLIQPAMAKQKAGLGHKAYDVSRLKDAAMEAAPDDASRELARQVAEEAGAIEDILYDLAFDLDNPSATVSGSNESFIAPRNAKNSTMRRGGTLPTDANSFLSSAQDLLAKNRDPASKHSSKTWDGFLSTVEALVESLTGESDIAGSSRDTSSVPESSQAVNTPPERVSREQAMARLKERFPSIPVGQRAKIVSNVEGEKEGRKVLRDAAAIDQAAQAWADQNQPTEQKGALPATATPPARPAVQPPVPPVPPNRPRSVRGEGLQGSKRAAALAAAEGILDPAAADAFAEWVDRTDVDLNVAVEILDVLRTITEREAKVSGLEEGARVKGAKLPKHDAARRVIGSLVQIYQGADPTTILHEVAGHAVFALATDAIRDTAAQFWYHKPFAELTESQQRAVDENVANDVVAEFFQPGSIMRQQRPAQHKSFVRRVVDFLRRAIGGMAGVRGVDARYRKYIRDVAAGKIEQYMARGEDSTTAPTTERFGERFQADESPGLDPAETHAAMREHFGVTRNPNEAGYVLPDGAMLDLSGRHEAGPGFEGGERWTDHRDLPIAGGTDAMVAAIQTGAIRVDRASGLIDLGAVPTPAQVRALSRMFAGRDIQVEVTAPDGGTAHYVYADKARVPKIRQMLQEAGEVIEGTRAPVRMRPDDPNERFQADEGEADRYRQQLADFEARRLGPQEMLDVGRTPPVLQMLGAPRLPLTITQGTIRKALRKHKVPMAVLRQLPELVHDPVMVFDSATERDSLVALTKAEYEGKPVVAAVHFNKHVARHIINDVASVYGKDSAKTVLGWVRRGLLRYRHTQKSLDWFQRIGLYLPERGYQRGKDSVPETVDAVNEESLDWARRAGLYLPGRGTPNQSIDSVPDETDVVKWQAGERFQADGSEPGRSEATWSKTPAETKRGASLLKRLKSPKVGVRSIVDFLNDALGVEMMVTRSQTTSKIPAHYVWGYHLVRTRSGAVQIDFHEAGHAMHALINHAAPRWDAGFSAMLVDLTKRKGSFASAETSEEGMAELARLYVVDPESIPRTLRNAFEAALAKHRPAILSALRDAHRAYQHHRNRPLDVQLRSFQADKGKKRSPAAAMRDAAYWGLYHILGGSVAIHKVQRQLFLGIAPQTVLGRLDPTGAIEMMRVALNKAYQSRTASRSRRSSFSGASRQPARTASTWRSCSATGPRTAPLL